MFIKRGSTRREGNLVGATPYPIPRVWTLLSPSSKLPPLATPCTMISSGASIKYGEKEEYFVKSEFAATAS